MISKYYEFILYVYYILCFYSGTTWIQELCYLVTTCGDFDTACSTPLHTRVPFLERWSPLQDKPNIDDVIMSPHPRLIKTHLPETFFTSQVRGQTVKVILMIRNPLDTLVSFYHFYVISRTLGFFSGSWDDFFQLIKTKHILFGDYFDWYKTWLNDLTLPNVLLVKYEDMHNNLKAVVKDVSLFLGKELHDDVIDKIVDHLSFDRMRANQMTNHSSTDYIKAGGSFMRKGKVGDWNNYISDHQREWIMRRYNDTLACNGIQLQFE